MHTGRQLNGRSENGSKSSHSSIASTMQRCSSSTLRGVSLASLANSDVDALIKVLPRMTYPALTEHEVTRLDASDLISLAGKVVGFLSPASGR
ncbi:phage tail assembly protein [Citrobacter freundii]|uniref:phage tail assembly protein n=1 Tax=Citrobacter freundii TaxID=546 RepID=UPI0035A25B64